MEFQNKTIFTDRDHAIVRAVEAHGFLRASQVVELVGGSGQQIRRRLQRLFHLGKLNRPRSQIDYYHQGGSREMVYSLPGKDVQRFYLEHALMTSEIAVAFQRACQKFQYAQMELLQEKQIEQLMEHNRQSNDPFQWHVDITHQLRVGVRPDRVLQVGLRDSLFPESQRATFFIEADRGTMPVSRAGLEQTSIFRKLLAYHSTWAQGLHRWLFRIDRFRVLIVAKDSTRIANMIEACQRLERGHRLFLFAEHEAITNCSDVFALPLLNGKGETDSLLNSNDLLSSR